MEALLIKNSKIKVYADPEKETLLIAEVELVRYLKKGLPFVIDDNKVSKDLNKVFNLEFWLAEVIVSHNAHFPKGYQTIFGKKVFNTVGQVTEYSQEPAIISPALQEDFVFVSDYDTSFWNSRVEGSELPQGSLY